MALNGTQSAWLSSREDAETVWFLATRMSVLASAKTTGGALGVIDCLLPPGFSPPLHVHSREDEPMYVVEGQVRFRAGEDEFLAGPGSFIFLPKGVPHTFVVEGDQPARVLELAMPGGLEQFHIEAGKPAEGPGLPPPAAPDVERLEEATRRYGIQQIGPPMVSVEE
ncbi:cupin domain-containing protein [Candidatus Nephthysia bennettiae]|uniref:Cupin domain-containing protein n=1 Tax=Candidatus Nephthysia bennettiae TaxID=3127016 RepID=A0A934N1D2_9BACT|nr:cupin domain-containing protein [Candidatus Dormibacteraeota bacterium]